MSVTVRTAARATAPVPLRRADTAALPSRADVAAVADTFVRLARSFTKTRAQFLAAAAHDVEWSAHLLLKTVSTEGPIRSSALAELVQADPSTVSRQVAGLVKDGLLERRADPEDGRACLLVLTPKADEVITEHNEIRIEHFGRMLGDWSERDLRKFASYLQRFTADFEQHRSDWLPERAEHQRSSAEGKK
ncbi:MAG: MarR family winged helix-turn-helix transcriptional regulator [Jatrophihabitantaceae bacterium]